MKKTVIFIAMLIAMTYVGIAQTTITNYDEIAPFSNGLAAVRLNDQWGFINEEGELVIEFRSDLVWNKSADTNKLGVLGISYPIFQNNRCPIVEYNADGIPFYGYIDQSGEVVIQPEYLNLTHFNSEFAIGIYVRKAFQGKNEIQIDLIKYYFTEVVIDIRGDIIWPIGEREHILTARRRYEIPELRAKLISSNLLALKKADQSWELQRFNLSL